MILSLIQVSHLCRKRRWFILFCALAACGGSGDKEVIFTELEIMNAAIGMLGTAHPADDFTTLGELPTVGTFTYRGYLSTQFGPTSGGNSSRLVGAMEIHVNFDQSLEMVTGSAYDFIDEESTQLDGALTLSGGTLVDVDQASDATFTFGGEGSLTDASDNTLDIKLAFSGDFLGEGADAVGGDVNGSVVVNGATSESLAGIFISEEVTP